MALLKRFMNSLPLILCLLSLSLVTACGSAGDKKDDSEGKSEVKADRVKTIISTYPKGAVVTFNGVPMGNTPFTIELPDKKEFEIKLELDGYWPHTETLVRDIDGWPTALAFRLRRKVR